MEQLKAKDKLIDEVLKTTDAANIKTYLDKSNEMARHTNDEAAPDRMEAGEDQPNSRLQSSRSKKKATLGHA